VIWGDEAVRKNFETDYLHNIAHQYESELTYSRQHSSGNPQREKPESESDATATDTGGAKRTNLYRIEAELLRHLGDHELKLRIAALRDVLTDLMTKESYAALAATFLKLDSEDNHDLLLQEAQYLVARVHRRYVAIPAVEILRADLARKLIFYLVVMFAISAAIVGAFHQTVGDTALGVLCSVALAGACGASVSTIMRLYAIDPRYEPGNTWLSIMRGKSTILVAPLLGVVFAVVFLLLIRGNLISGQLFPDFKSGPISNLHPFSEIISCNEKEHGDCVGAIGDYAKLIVWGFLAGWAERMVPEVLDRLTTKAREAASS
jgi:hypothetical protein